MCTQSWDIFQSLNTHRVHINTVCCVQVQSGWWSSIRRIKAGGWGSAWQRINTGTVTCVCVGPTECVCAVCICVCVCDVGDQPRPPSWPLASAFQQNEAQKQKTGDKGNDWKWGKSSLKNKKFPSRSAAGGKKTRKHIAKLKTSTARTHYWYLLLWNNSILLPLIFNFLLLNSICTVLTSCYVDDENANLLKKS